MLFFWFTLCRNSHTRSTMQQSTQFWHTIRSQNHVQLRTRYDGGFLVSLHDTYGLIHAQQFVVICACSLLHRRMWTTPCALHHSGTHHEISHVYSFNGASSVVVLIEATASQSQECRERYQWSNTQIHTQAQTGWSSIIKIISTKHYGKLRGLDVRDE